MRHLLVLSAGLMVAGCATFIEGTGQSVALDTQPPGATCNIYRFGELIGSIVSTPGSTRVDKSKNDLTVVCGKSGYQTASISQTPHVSETTFLGNGALFGIIGEGIDAASGANYSYRI